MREVASSGTKISHFPIRAALLLLIFVGLHACWQALSDTTLERWVIQDATVWPAAAIANLITPQIGIAAAGSSLRAPGVGLNILNGCEGTEALFFLVAAFAVAPLEWRSRLKGVALGIFVVFVINQVRILVLFYASLRNSGWFDPLHSVITPIFVIALIGVYFYAWLVRSGS